VQLEGAEYVGFAGRSADARRKATVEVTPDNVVMLTLCRLADVNPVARSRTNLRSASCWWPAERT